MEILPFDILIRDPKIKKIFRIKLVDITMEIFYSIENLT
ncbi:hypothetical protein P689_122103 [Candidatus Riesia pediculischaeffi PTSU]|uniref:Uncharacterized protein n=1 Tax=Candidatus Riesia pediculischaeffi PTSU TaxID=1401651 RepID=A0A0C1V674_9ENTR|nr:hypothetical protein P689_122103 [Candidatus Riesia pediculischaeffi PTSU]